MNTIADERNDPPQITLTPLVHEPHNRRRVATNFLAMTVSSGLGLLVGVFATIYSRRVLGPEVIGQVNWNLAVLAYLALIASPGLQIIGQRQVAKDPARAVRLTSLVLSMQALFALAAYAVVAVLAALDLRGQQVSALLLLQGINLFITGCNVGWVLQAHERMVAPAVVALITNVLQVPALIALVHGPDDVFIYVLYTMPFSLIAAAYNFWYLGRRGLVRLDQLRPTLAGAKDILRESWPLALSQGATLLYYNCDAIILGFTSGDASVGLYTTAYRLMLMSSIISGAMWNAYFPILARAQAEAHQATRITGEFITLLAWMGLPLAALGWASGRHVIDLMFGARFAESGLYFEWLCLNVGLIFVNIGIGLPLLTWGFQKTQFKIVAAAGVVNLALNLVLIPIYGAWGAVGTTLGAETMVLVLTIVARRRIGIGWNPLFPMIAAPLLCSLAVALVIKMLPKSLDPYWWLELAVGIAALGACLFVFERRIFRTALQLLRRAQA